MKESLFIEVKHIEIDADHNDQAYDNKGFGLEVACPPGSPSERLRGCGLDISSYLLSAPSQVFMKTKMMVNCKLTDGEQYINSKAWTRVNNNSSGALTDQTLHRPLMGTNILTTRYQQTQTTDEAVQIYLSKYVLNTESKNITTYDVVTPEMENTQRTDEHEGKICLKELEEIQTNEQEMKGKKKNEEKKSSRHFLQRCFDLLGRVRRYLKPRRKKK